MYRVNGIGTTIYGSANPEDLIGNDRLAAEQAGLLPQSYQVTKWFTFFFLPVIPLGTYRVLKVKQGFWTLQPPAYSMRKVDWDWSQIARHYAFAYSVPVLLWIFALFS
jgi:hypothetical protein